MPTLTPGVEHSITLVTRSFDFNASHELRLLPPDHQCRRNHGHNYIVTVEAAVDAGDGDGWPEAFQRHLDDSFDHRLLNDRVDFHPTSELLARHLGDWFSSGIQPHHLVTLHAIEVAETPSSAARLETRTGEISISKTFRTDSWGVVTVVLGADDLDEYGFIADFAALAPLRDYLRRPGNHTHSSAPAAHLASWFRANLEPQIRAHLLSIRTTDVTMTSTWERGVRA